MLEFHLNNLFKTSTRRYLHKFINFRFLEKFLENTLAYHMEWRLKVSTIMVDEIIHVLKSGRTWLQS